MSSARPEFYIASNRHLCNGACSLRVVQGFGSLSVAAMLHKLKEMLFLFGSSLIVSGAHTFQSKETIVHKYTICFSLTDSLHTAGNKPLEKYIGVLGYAHPGRFMDSVAYLLLQCCVHRTLVCVLRLTASFLVITTGDSYSAKVKLFTMSMGHAHSTLLGTIPSSLTSQLSA